MSKLNSKSISEAYPVCHFHFLKKAFPRSNWFCQLSPNIVTYSTLKKEGNFIMASELKIIDLHPVAKKSYSCKQCGYSCNTTSKLKRHTRVHSGAKPFVCGQCNYSCTTAANLKRHKRTHSGEKPYSCKQCDYSCTTASDLKKHLLTHSGEKSFNCNQCTSSFAQSGHLKQHMTTQHNTTQERSISTAISATFHATGLVISRYTWDNTLEKNPLHATSVASLAGIQVVWNITDFLTLVRNLLLARNAITQAKLIVIWRNTWKSILERLSHQHQTKMHCISIDSLVLFWPHIVVFFCYDKTYVNYRNNSNSSFISIQDNFSL